MPFGDKQTVTPSQLRPYIPGRVFIEGLKLKNCFLIHVNLRIKGSISDINQNRFSRSVKKLYGETGIKKS